MYEDLHEGIVALFEEAQLLGRSWRAFRPALSVEEERQFRRAYANRADRRAWVREYRRRPERRKAAVKMKDAYRKRVDRLLRSRRPKFEIVSIVPFDVHQGETISRYCARCGNVEELRPGLNRWQHMTPYGACERAAR